MGVLEGRVFALEAELERRTVEMDRIDRIEYEVRALRRIVRNLESERAASSDPKGKGKQLEEDWEEYEEPEEEEPPPSADEN
jgi:hypothetical protein